MRKSGESFAFTTGTLEKDTHPYRHVKNTSSSRQSLPRQGLPGDCQDPESMEGEQRHVPVIWVPAIPAGMTLDLTIHYFV